jgi:hypothetical protein
MLISATAPPALGDHAAISGLEQITERLAGGFVAHHRAQGDEHETEFAVFSGPALAAPTAAVSSLVPPMVMKIEQRRQPLAGLENDVAPVAAVAPVRASPGHELLAAKAHASIAPAATGDFDNHAIDEHG